MRRQAAGAEELTLGRPGWTCNGWHARRRAVQALRDRRYGFAYRGRGGREAMTETSSEPIVRMAELLIDPAQIESYKALLAEEIETSVTMEPGVLMLCAV